MKVKALISFTTDDLSLSLRMGEVAEIANNLANELIADGYVEEYSDGGGGDFSTAEVTIVNASEEEEIWASIPVLDDNVLTWNANVGAGETQVFKMPIPTGGAYVNSTDLLGTVSGDITFEDGILTITGNGTFTVTGID